MASGGARPGSGRKAAEPDKKRVQMTMWVDPSTRDYIYGSAAELDMPTGRWMDLAVVAMKVGTERKSQD